MKLHEDKFAFLNIINLIHEASSIRADILEKDYYVTLLLRELAGKQVTLPAYFKGGTALYKAQKSIRRFSEDIDLTVCIDNCSNSQAKKRLEMATKKYQALPRTSRKDLEDDRKGSITTVYDYTPLVGVDSDDPLQRFGYVKVEGTSFTVSEPFTPLEIEPILYTYATEEQRNILQSQYNVAPFMINTIRLERIFADKIFAAEFYYERKMYFDVAKHLYDVSVMFDLEQIQEMIQNQQTFLEMLGYKRLEETRRTGSDLAEKKFSDFQLLRGFSDNEALRKDYQNMQRNYVFAEEDALSFGFVVEQWKKLGEVAPFHQGATAVVGHEDAGGRKEYSGGAGTADLRGVDPHFFHFSGTEKSRIDNPATSVTLRRKNCRFFIPIHTYTRIIHGHIGFCQAV